MTRQRIDDQTLEGIAAEFLRSALGGPESEVGKARERNLIAYNAVAEGDFAPPDVADRSDFVATDVADTVHGLLPQLMRIFVSDEKAVEFEARKPDGEDLAKSVTAYINHLFYVRNDGLNVLYDWFHGALVQKVGHVMVWCEEEAEDSRQTFTGLTEDQVALLMQDGGEVAEASQDADGTLSVTIIREGKRMAVKVAAVAPHEMRIDPNARWGAEPAAIGREFLRPLYELDEEGIDTSELAEGDSYTNSEAQEMLGEDADFTSREIHRSHRLIRCAELYIKLDRDGDGIAEWLKIGMVGEKIAIRDGEPDIEQVDDHPFCEICPQPRPHAYFGDCPADFAYQTQVLRTRLMRAIQDNLYLTVNGRTYVNTEAGVNIDDLLDSRPGGIVRGNKAPGDAFMPIVQPNIAAPAWQALEWADAWREDRTGFNRYSAGTDRDALNKTATGVQMLTAKADMRTELIARFFAQGVRKMFAKLLKLATKYQNQQEWMQVSGQFVAVNPSEWHDQFNLKINVGLGHGTNEQKLQRLMGMFAMQQAGAQFGVVGPEQIGATIRAAAAANEFKNPDQFALEAPQGPPPEVQQMQQQMQQMGQELEQAKAQAASKDGELQVKHREIDLKERELGLREHEAVANLDLQARAAERSDHESALKGAEAQQRMSRTDDVVERINQLEQVVASLLQAFTQPPAMEGETGMDAPAAPMEGL